MAVERESRCVCTIAPFVYHTTGLPFSLHIHTHALAASSNGGGPSQLYPQNRKLRIDRRLDPLIFSPAAFTVVTAAAAVSQRRKTKFPT